MGWLSSILASSPARKALNLLLPAITIALFLLNFRSAGERAGRLAERLSTSERIHGIQRQMRNAAPLIGILWLGTCGMARSDDRSPSPPVPHDTMADRTRAADEVKTLPEGAVIARMLSDSAVLRDQAGACR